MASFPSTETEAAWGTVIPARFPPSEYVAADPVTIGRI
jgi:hypothetical protein